MDKMLCYWDLLPHNSAGNTMGALLHSPHLIPSFEFKSIFINLSFFPPVILFTSTCLHTDIYLCCTYIIRVQPVTMARTEWFADGGLV